MKNIVGLTGIIGSGKSQVSKYFTNLGIDVIDTDMINNDILTNDHETINLIFEAFGKAMIEDNQLNRRAMRELIFNDYKAKITLENILHPRIYEVSQRLIQQSTSKYCILVVPLLFKSLYYIKQTKLNVVVTCSQAKLYKRLYLRSNLTKNLIEQIIANQLPLTTQLRLADYILTNNKDLNHLEQQVSALHTYLTNHFKIKLLNS